MDRTDGRAERVIDHARSLGADMRGLASELSAACGEMRANVDLAGGIQRHPFRSMLMAAGAGYVLGGGLFTTLTGVMVRVGVRAMLVPALNRALTEAAVKAAG